MRQNALYSMSGGEWQYTDGVGLWWYSSTDVMRSNPASDTGLLSFPLACVGAELTSSRGMRTGSATVSPG